MIAGAWRGRRLQAPAGRATRPTRDSVREAVFDVLQGLVEPLVGDTDASMTDTAAASNHETCADRMLCGHRAVDLFAGAGGLGIEALSRGALSCAFVENDAAAVRALRANLKALGVGAARGRVCAADYRRALQADVAAGRRYTLLFVDPPYAAYAAVEPVLVNVFGEVLVPGAVVVVETARHQAVDLALPVVRVKRYGDTQVTFLEAGPGSS